MPYELDNTPDGTTDGSTDEREVTDANGPSGGDGDGSRTAGETLEDAVGVTVPDEHVGAFVAEAFEDVERDTAWCDVVDAFVPPSARDEWNELSPRERATAVLDRASEYDRSAVDGFAEIPCSVGGDLDRETLSEALRCRRNADQFRDGVAAAYADDIVDDDALVGAVDDSAFDTELVGERERLLEEVDEYYDVDFRPYGGQLFDADEGPDPDVDHDASATW